MSQISKKPASLPLRKRLRPTVNLNVAGRRRNNVKDASSLPDGEADPPQKINGSSNKIDSSEHNFIQLDVGNSSNSGNFIPVEKLCEEAHNTSFESRISVLSTVSTIILQNSTSAPCIKEQHIKHNLNESIDSSASTVIISCNDNIPDDFGKTRDNVLRETVDFDDSRSISSCVSTVLINGNVSGAHTNQVKEDNNCTTNLEEQSCISVTSASPDVLHNDKQLRNSNSHEKQLEETTSSVVEKRKKSVYDTISVTSDKDNGYISNNSVSTRTSPVAHLNCSNADSESLLGDDRSSVFSYTSGNDKLPHKYRRRVNSVTKWLTDAKKEFEARYVDKKPERSSLRMLDLIYYNPTTNPMKSTPDSSQEVLISSNEPVSNGVTEEDADEPEEQKDSDKEEEEEKEKEEEEKEKEEGEEESSRIPAPRVKVGPNGEIVLDEQSLVIETTQSKKSRKEIANLTVVVDSGSNTTYHTYSKKKRRRCDWSIQETVRFYKALQSIGTDFSLMQSLFPSRSRLDLKAKFKKEERINGHLIEKALRFPSLFDLSELEKEQVNENEVSKTNKKRDKKGKKRSLTALGFDEEDRAPAKKKGKKNPKGKSVKTLSQRNRRSENNRVSRSKRNSDSSSGDESLNTAEDLPSGKDNTKETEVLNSRPKRVTDANRPNYAAMENGQAYLEDGISLLECSSNEDEEVTDDVEREVMPVNEGELEEGSHETVVEHDVQSNAPIPLDSFSVNNVQPGSIVLLTTECPGNPGYQICNVFMVQDNSAGFNQSDSVSANTNNCYSFPTNEISSSIIDAGGETQPS